MTATYSASQIAGIKDAIKQTEAFIAKEEKRNPDLRPAEVTKLLAWYKSHLVKLNGMLNA